MVPWLGWRGQAQGVAGGALVPESEGCVGGDIWAMLGSAASPRAVLSVKITVSDEINVKYQEG